MFTHTLALSTAVSACSSSPGSAWSSTPAGASKSYGANTPSSSARDANVLSTPNATSPSGESLVSTSSLVRVPPSPTWRISSW